MFIEVFKLKIGPFDNIFIKNKAYMDHKKKFEMDPSNTLFERNSKEAFKCVSAFHLMNLLEKTGYMTNRIEFPEYIINGLENGNIPFVAQTVCCISGYTNNPNPIYCQNRIIYSKKLKNNSNRRFSVYYKELMKTIVKEWNSYKNLVDDETFKRYKAALIIFKVFFRVFYFKALPMVLDENTFNKCIDKCTEFANYYKFDATSEKYVRRRFIRKAALMFNDDVAWLLVYNELCRFKLIG